MNTLSVPGRRTLRAADEGGAPRCVPAWRAPLVLLAAGTAACLLLPEQQGLLTRVFITALFVLSLDLIVGIAGLATLGHAALFGVGAYAAGIFALRGLPDPTLGLAVGIAAGSLLALATGTFLLRYQGFTFLMLTVAVAQIVLSIAQKARDWTGADDGLSGFTMGPLLGRFAFDIEGRVAAFYTLAVLVIGLYVLRRVVDSPFGLAVRGIHENRARMAALGTPVFVRLLTMYAIAGGVAGAAGALSAQTTAVVGLDSMSFALSAEALVMLVLGGAGRLTGALVGSAVFTLLHHTAASINPYHWLFVVGALLMLVVLVPPAQAWAWLRRRLGATA
ncbi:MULTISPECIES: branched-chain amino acid ABC transporter permease [Ramlibacter]|uniref:Branched-chain amino acid ABC transporter permease n=1 Tax=Ramlibacter pinisoli TaxID=2682844 RepID=A0A6N8ILY6_9BURK|nr:MULTISPECIES: branched-chain amino acid ABC transporter permease [Ramlibacter]MBA2960505.1 branched-chain amino acid ABC transporter permease [Ramlibacter sp. CGMCC 1.13660]MVQ27837.1 branched-chain amino acid ABC transporter permease [Ramlibacter pinisoli]